MSLGLAVLFVGFLYLTIVDRAFRRIALAGIGILVIGALLLFAWLENNRVDAQHKQELAKTYIKTAEIEIADPRVTFSTLDGRPSRITGRIRNNSGYALDGLNIRLTFQDCLPPKAGKQPVQCETVGDENEQIWITVPPSQSRDFDHFLSGPILSPRGKIEWDYQVLSASAHLD